MYQLASAARGPVLPTGSGCKAKSHNKGCFHPRGAQWLFAVDSRARDFAWLFFGVPAGGGEHLWAVLGVEAQDWCRTQAAAAGLVCPSWERLGKQSHTHTTDAHKARAVGHGGEIKLWLMLKIASMALLQELELSPHLHRDACETDFLWFLVPSL